MHPCSSFLVLPLFAFANAGVAITAVDIFDPVALGVISGLALGKPAGVFAFTWFAVRLGIARKPGEIGWPHMLGTGTLAGIGFTMAVFIANLAFEGAALESAKFGILMASLICGMGDGDAYCVDGGETAPTPCTLRRSLRGLAGMLAPQSSDVGAYWRRSDRRCNL